MKNLKLTITGILLIFAFTVFSQEIITGTATNVYDGDTFTLLTQEGTEIRIRVSGIDAPEKDQEFGIESRDFARGLIDGKQVRVYLEPGETYGRKLGIVITPDGKHFNYEMVAGGFAWHYAHYNKDKFLATAQEKAKENKKGLWAKDNPMAPWDWRKLN